MTTITTPGGWRLTDRRHEHAPPFAADVPAPSPFDPPTDPAEVRALAKFNASRARGSRGYHATPLDFGQRLERYRDQCGGGAKWRPTPKQRRRMDKKAGQTNYRAELAHQAGWIDGE